MISKDNNKAQIISYVYVIVYPIVYTLVICPYADQIMHMYVNIS